MKRLSILVILAMLVGVLLTACSSGAGGDPSATVKDAMTAITGKQFDKLADFACAAKKTEVQNQFNPAAALANQGMNKDDVQKLLDSMTISFDNPQFGTPAISGDAASVPMQGKLAIKLDKDKLKAFVSSALQGQGVSNLTDDQINQALDAVAGQLEQGQDISTTVDLIRENGKWVICPKS